MIGLIIKPTSFFLFHILQLKFMLNCIICYEKVAMHFIYIYYREPVLLKTFAIYIYYFYIVPLTADTPQKSIRVSIMSQQGRRGVHPRQKKLLAEREKESEWSGRLAKRQLEQAGARACNSYWLCCCARCPFASCAAALVAAGVACIK